MFSAIQNRQKDLYVEEFLKIHSSSGFKENERISVMFYGESRSEEPNKIKNALINKFIEALKTEKLPANLTIGIYVKWYEQFDYLSELLNAIKFAKCNQGIAITLSGIAWDKNNFSTIKQIAAYNPCLINVVFKEGDNCHYMPCDDSQKYIQDITNLCTRNDYALRFPNLKGIVDVYCDAKNSGITKPQIINLINSLDHALEQKVEVNFQVEKSLKKI